MPKPGEYTYHDRIGEEGRAHAINKPFSDRNAGSIFMDMGLIFELLPPLPARVLECGCGTGWLSYFMARRGYEVVGQDCASNAIELANRNPVFVKIDSVTFVCSDFEDLNYKNAFDAIFFYGSLHHAVDEEKAIRCAYKALKPKGVVIAIEPRMRAGETFTRNHSDL